MSLSRAQRWIPEAKILNRPPFPLRVAQLVARRRQPGFTLPLRSPVRVRSRGVKINRATHDENRNAVQQSHEHHELVKQRAGNQLGEDDRAISVHAVGYNITRVTLECIANLSTSFEEAGAVELDFIDGMKAQLRDYLKTYDPKRQEEAGAPNGVTLQ